MSNCVPDSLINSSQIMGKVKISLNEIKVFFFLPNYELITQFLSVFTLILSSIKSTYFFYVTLYYYYYYYFLEITYY